MAETKFDRVTKKTIENGEKIKFVLVTIKFKVQRLKTLVYENKKKLREREELLNKAKKLALSMEKGKVKKKTIEEYYEEFEREMEEEQERKSGETFKGESNYKENDFARSRRCKVRNKESEKGLN